MAKINKKCEQIKNSNHISPIPIEKNISQTTTKDFLTSGWTSTSIGNRRNKPRSGMDAR